MLVTRAPHQASELADRLRDAGAVPILIPTISIADPASWASLDGALVSLATYDWIVFTSANAVDSFHRRAQLYPHPPEHTPRIAVIGAATERAAHAAGLMVDLVPPSPVGESLAEALTPLAKGSSFLLVRAAEARDLLPDAITAAGGRVTIAEAYRNEIPLSSVTALRELLSSPATCPDAITFTSASTARNLVALLEEARLILPSRIVCASIGPITSAAMRELHLVPHVEAQEASVSALVAALAEYFASR